MYHFLHGIFLGDLFAFWLETESAGISLGLLQMHPAFPDWQKNIKSEKKKTFFNSNVSDCIFF